MSSLSAGRASDGGRLLPEPGCPRGSAADPSELEREIEDAIAFYDQAISDLAVLSSTTASDTARVAAIRARLSARSRRLELLSVAGVLDDVRTEIDVSAIANAVAQAFDEHGVSNDARRAVLAALRGGDASTRLRARVIAAELAQRSS